MSTLIFTISFVFCSDWGSARGPIFIICAARYIYTYREKPNDNGSNE